MFRMYITTACLNVLFFFYFYCLMDYHILRVEKIELLLFLIFSFPDSKKLEIFFFYYEMK